MHKYLPVSLALAAAVSAGPALAATASHTAFESGAIEAGGDSGSNDYYGSGNDDNFGEFGIASFSFSPADFGLTAVADVTSVDYTLTHNDRFFSDGDSFSLYYSPDDFDAAYTGLGYDDSGASDPNGFDESQFGEVFDLGSFSYTPKDGGETDVYSLGFAGAALDSLISEINTGSDFQLMIVADAVGDDVTFSGVGNTFDPGDPELAVTAVPLPAALPLMGFALAAMGFAARRKS